MLAVLAWNKRCRAAAPFSTFCVIYLGLALSGVSYFQVVLAFGLLCYAGGRARGVPWLRGTATWARWGSFDATVCFLSVAAWLLAAAALLSWYLLLHPNIADILGAFVPDLPLGVLIAGGLIFSMVNAAVEEGAYRGVMLHALDRSLGPGFAALLLQALAFGAIHSKVSARLARRWPRLYLRAAHGSHSATRWRHVRSLDSARFHRRRDRGNRALPGTA
jgi:hypothetical protein